MTNQEKQPSESQIAATLPLVGDRELAIHWWTSYNKHFKDKPINHPEEALEYIYFFRFK